MARAKRACGWCRNTSVASVYEKRARKTEHKEESLAKKRAKNLYSVGRNPKIRGVRSQLQGRNQSTR